MLQISERHLAVVIPLLAAKIKDMAEAVTATDARVDNLSEAELNDRVELQDMLAQYEDILDVLRNEYEKSLAAGINLPSFDDLIAKFGID